MAIWLPVRPVVKSIIELFSLLGKSCLASSRAGNRAGIVPAGKAAGSRDGCNDGIFAA